METVSSSSAKPVTSTLKKPDDLTRIKGIGPVRQKWLRAHLGINSFAELANLQVDELLDRMKEAGQTVSPEEVESWIVQAKELVRKTAESDPAVSDVSQKTAKKLKNGWTPFASFVVEFQSRKENGDVAFRTSVHHVERDTGEVWPGIAGEQLGQWIETVVDQEIPARQAEAAQELAIQSGKVPEIALARVRVFQPPDGPQIGGLEEGRQFLGMVEGGKPFVMEVALRLSGDVPITVLPSPEQYEVQLYVRNMVTGLDEDVHAMRIEPHQEDDRLVYQVVLPAGGLQSGVYRPSVLIRTLDKRPLYSYIELPLLHVM